MSAVLIDVAWRGLEVGRQVPLHEVTEDHGRIDVALPMPVGSALSLRAGDGLEIAAVVTRVHEQSSAGGETAGMIVEPALDEASRTWWSARAAESAAAPPSSSASDSMSRSRDDASMVIVVPTDPTARPTMVFQAVKLSDVPAMPQVHVTPTTAPAMPAVQVAPTPPAAVVHPPVVAAVQPAVLPTAPRGGTSGDTDGAAAIAQLPTAALTPEDLRAARAAAIADAAADLAGAVAESAAAAQAPTAPVLPGDGRRPELMAATTHPDDGPEDTSRTSIMAAVDIEAIMADSAAGGDDGGAADGVVSGEASGDSAGDSRSGPRKGGPRGKRRKGR